MVTANNKNSLFDVEFIWLEETLKYSETSNYANEEYNGKDTTNRYNTQAVSNIINEVLGLYGEGGNEFRVGVVGGDCSIFY